MINKDDKILIENYIQELKKIKSGFSLYFKENGLLKIDMIWDDVNLLKDSFNLGTDFLQLGEEDLIKEIEKNIYSYIRRKMLHRKR